MACQAASSTPAPITPIRSKEQWTFPPPVLHSQVFSQPHQDRLPATPGVWVFNPNSAAKTPLGNAGFRDRNPSPQPRELCMEPLPEEPKAYLAKDRHHPHAVPIPTHSPSTVCIPKSPCGEKFDLSAKASAMPEPHLSNPRHHPHAVPIPTSSSSTTCLPKSPRGEKFDILCNLPGPRSLGEERLRQKPKDSPSPSINHQLSTINHPE